MPRVRGTVLVGEQVIASTARAIETALTPSRDQDDLNGLRARAGAHALHTAVQHGIVKARGDYQSEVGWPAYVRLVERHAAGADVIVADNYGEAGALVLFGRALPPVASGDVTMRYWRPRVTGRRALLVGYSRHTSSFCRSYRVARISAADDSDEGGEPIARCTLRGTLADAWPSIVATQN